MQRCWPKLVYWTVLMLLLRVGSIGELRWQAHAQQHCLLARVMETTEQGARPDWHLQMQAGTLPT